MNAISMEKAYNPKDFEDRLYDFWQEHNLFAPDETNPVDPFVVVIPPPNVTGVLHMGHGLNNSLQDILIRYNRMLGKPTLWVPGTDHAGIATQNVVERQLQKNGQSRHDLGREKFIEKTWEVKEKHHETITRQLKKIGSSCDWSRERFTMDDGLSKAVREVFVRLYEKDMVYRGKYLVNWCPSCTTALADDEVEHAEEPGKLYRVRYPYSDGSGDIIVATTRPETMFGDTAVAVHPEDERYKDKIGKTVDLPLTDRKIKIIADTYVDREFGSGAVKMTPAHDPNDWEVGLRHDLERINILNDDGTLNENVPEYLRGMKAEAARNLTVEALQKGGFYIDDHEHSHQVGHCYRCNTVIEPYMSEQWFVRMQPMAEKALKALEDDKIRFYPKRWENTYTHWLGGIRDWCISRQLWWGHRIPVWYCNDCGEMIVSRDDVTSCPKCGHEDLRQDEDVLDTWFSSWLWPFSTLGWPENTADVKKFFPTSTLVTGYDIIFFWVARMIMASLEFLGEVPFRDIYITQLVRDKQGRKMSKSLGNGIDPLVVVDQFGADALKFTMAYVSAQGQDIPLDMESFRIGTKFCNKIWNASRYILMNLEGRELQANPQLKPVDRWIIHRLNEAAAEMEKAMKAYRFDDMGHLVYEYFWNDFCDWYIEASKENLYSKIEDEKNRAVSVLVNVLEESLKLLHPFVPFLSEEIYQKLPGHELSIINQPYPVFSEDRKQTDEAEYFAVLQDMVRKIRTLRSEFAVPPEKKVKVAVLLEKEFRGAVYLKSLSTLIASLTKASEVLFIDDVSEASEGVGAVGRGFETYVFIRDALDVPKEIEKLKKNIEKTEKLYKSTESKLKNENFVSRAPVEVIAKENEKLEEFSRGIEKMNAYLKELQ